MNSNENVKTIDNSASRETIEMPRDSASIESPRLTMAMRQSVESLEKLNFKNTKRREREIFKSPYAQSMFKDKEILNQASKMFLTEMKTQDVRLTTIRNRSHQMNSLL